MHSSIPQQNSIPKAHYTNKEFTRKQHVNNPVVESHQQAGGYTHNHHQQPPSHAHHAYHQPQQHNPQHSGEPRTNHNHLQMAASANRNSMCNNNASSLSSEMSAMSVHNNSSSHHGSGSSHMNSTQMSRNSLGGSFNQRQQGSVEKLLHSYGFIDSEVQKDGHLFFHYSEVVGGDVNTLAIGDCVEFNLSYDYRSSRWLAVSVTKVESALTVSKEQFSGQILIKAEPQEKFKSSLDRSGRISYEQSGECFYIPYSTLDLEDETKPNQTPSAADKVTFFIATDKKTGHMWATAVKKLEPPPMSQGVVCSLKENFGFIERSDVVREIFFHYSEYDGNIAELVLGDDVEFNIQTRNGKEVATNIAKLPEGTVVFEDVSTEKKRGKIAKVIKATRKHAEPLAGSISYETLDDTKFIPYSERDISGEFTLFVGDVVDFQIAKDRRDGLLHATSISLCEESFIVSKEKRDKGVVSSVKESYGFLQILSPDCSTGMGDAQLFFHFNELYDNITTPVVVGDEIEFTVAYDPGNKSKPIAIRIRKLPKGSIKQDQVVSSQTFTGTVIQDQPGKPKKASPPNNSQRDSDTGLIKYTINGKDSATIVYLVKDADLRYGDKVSFNVCEVKRSSDPSAKKAVNIKLLSRLGIQTGFVCSLKDSYGFIETISVDDEIFFHYSCYSGDANDMNIGDLVEYNLVCRNKKISAESVKKAANNKLKVDVESKVLAGQVTRVIRDPNNADKDLYCGTITADPTKPGAPAITYPFGIISLCNKRSCPPVGTVVEFQVAKVTNSSERAVNVLCVKDLVQARVDSIKGAFGFLDVEERDKKVYFNMTDIQDGSVLAVGDTVQCVVVPQLGSNRTSALCLRKIKSSPPSAPPQARPERLISKLKTQMSMTEGPRLVVIRQPRRPDGKSKGFAARTPLSAKHEATAAKA